ncbi:MAG: sigma-70 family RNA polymerase sigma factor [Elusimicrobia bacterium]|nr:sigma-70 family RNA polymerase sigma factor [Elusimicrobiota bacterium]
MKQQRLCIPANDYSKDKVQSSLNGDNLEKLISKIVDLDEEINTLIDSYVSLKWEIIKKLERLENKKQREVLLLKYIDGESISEIAFEMNLSANRIKQITNDGIMNFAKIS